MAKDRGQIGYIYSDELLEKCDRLPRFRGRAKLVHSLIKAYNLLELISIEQPDSGSDDVLKHFHSAEYISCLRQVEEYMDYSETEVDYSFCLDELSASDHGLGYDCPLFPLIYETLVLLAKSTITAAQCLASGLYQVVVNFFGGWHHAHRDEAAGFCYINDIVLGILKLREKFSRVLYLDLDVHHGDGVQEAFYYTDKVMTVSFHKFESGFYPGTGSLEEVGKGNGQYFTLNVPLKDGTTDEEFIRVFKSTLGLVWTRYQPDVIVCQCGADTLAGDPMGAFSLTSKALTECVSELRSLNVPLMILGGGGYNFPNTARCWTEILSRVCGKVIEEDIPEHDNLDRYGPSYDLTVYPGTKRSSNSSFYLSNLLLQIREHAKNITSRKPLASRQESKDTTNQTKKRRREKGERALKKSKVADENEPPL